MIFQADDERTRELLDEVYRVYGQFSAWKLRNMTHDEEPWKDAYEGNMIITHQDLKQYFKTQLVNDSDEVYVKKAKVNPTAGESLIKMMRGKVTVKMTTDEIMVLTR
ncbi:Panacea domain-containing protein [Iningainema tapete]|uniref:Panacea domain-containing protein n=1 Tax=Iningainema tapete TaxID=2806730 RepID=UPI002352ED88|nr:type II toxin-antitoxin system antitoxin SocA domain-containing protein [Iningainema tapete]